MESWIVVLGIIVGYSILCLLLGFQGWRVGKVSIEDFIVGGRQMGFIVLYFTYTATFMSAFAFLGAPGWIYSRGISFFATFLSCVFSPLFMYIFGYRCWLLGKRYGYMTPSDLLADFYGSELVRVLVAILSLIFLVPYIQTQMMASGYLLEAGTGGRIPYMWGTLFLLAVVVIYSLLGGIRSVAWTDVFQGIWGFIAIWIAGLYVSQVALGTIDPAYIIRRIEEAKPNLLLFSDAGWPAYMSMFLGLAGISLYPPMWIRYYVAKSPKLLKWTAVLSPIYYVWWYLPCFMIGWAGALVMPGLKQPDNILPEMMVKYAPPWLVGLVFAGGMAAAMSTADSQLHACSSIFTRDIYQRFLNPRASERSMVILSRALVAILGFLSVVLAVLFPSMIVMIVAMSLSSFLMLIPLLVGALYWPRATKWGAIAGLVVGLAVLALTMFVYTRPFGISGVVPGVWALAASSIAFAIVSYATKPPPPEVISRFHGYLESEIYGGEGEP